MRTLEYTVHRNVPYQRDENSIFCFSFLGYSWIRNLLQIEVYFPIANNCMLVTRNSFYIIKCNGWEFNAEDENVYDDKKANTTNTFL